ncbi:MAG: PCRF domain-containing protein, partial [bacterium]|nr:PCRF domain-containing protein [bacterium]
MDIDRLISDKIKEKKERLKEVENLLQDQLILRDREKLISLSREQKELQEVARLADDYGRILKDIKDTEELVASDEEEISKLATEEISSLQAKKDYIGRELVGRLTPQDIDSDRNVILEIRAGAGGEEASLFAKDLYRMYSRYAERQGWVVEPIVVKHTEVRGIKELIFLIKGRHAYSRLRFESGVHRVQRVPVTESGGRIHTSTCTVAVLPEAKETDITIDPKDIKMDFF